MADRLGAVPVVIYSALRLLLMGAVFAISYLLGAGILIAALLAIIVGWSLSFLLLKPYADAATTWLADRRKAQAAGDIPRFSAQISADEAAEDALISGAESEGELPPEPDAPGVQPPSQGEAETEQ